MTGGSLDGAIQDSVEMYDPDTDVWSAGTSLPIELKYHQVDIIQIVGVIMRYDHESGREPRGRSLRVGWSDGVQWVHGE